MQHVQAPPDLVPMQKKALRRGLFLGEAGLEKSFHYQRNNPAHYYTQHYLDWCQLHLQTLLCYQLLIV
jgi:hypothetical protein